MIDRIIFGDNQFFGINHMSEDKARALEERFRDLQSIVDVIDIAYGAGIHAFMLNSNDRAVDICNYLRENKSRYPELRMYPSIPYAYKYADAVGEKGVFGALKDIILSNSSVGAITELFKKGGRSLFEKDIFRLMEILIDLEMKIYSGLTIKAVFLQNIITDLLLGFKVHKVFQAYDAYIKEKYFVEPGYITVNLPRLVGFLDECGIRNPVVCSSINKIGQSMNPDKASYEKVVAEHNFQPMAMSILASGAIKPQDAVAYIGSLHSVQSIVFGASSKQHIVETKALIEDQFQREIENV